MSHCRGMRLREGEDTMEAAIGLLREDAVFRHFYALCQIPHGSGNEGPIGAYLLNWAKELGLEAERDEAGNVLIRKAASPGREGAPVTMLQAHMDMVCEKAEGIAHDFAKDPIQWVVDGDELSTGGRTTLGADDGIGVALAMALLADDTLTHPALEVLFTTMEEEDLSGASRFDTGKLKARYLFNLDHVKDDEILCGSCGGMQVDVRVPLSAKPPQEGWRPCRLEVSGLRGGHSGEDIHRGRDNANILLLRSLLALEECCAFRLGPIRGGSFRLAIARDAEAVVWIKASDRDTARECLTRMERAFRGELPASADGVRVALEELSDAPAWTVEPGRVLDALSLLPDGIFQMSEAFHGIVDTSDNLGEVYLSESGLHCVLEIRSASESRRTYLYQRMRRLAALLGGECTCCNEYPSWSFRHSSPLRALCGGVYHELFGEPPKFLVVHAGLEVGCFFGTKPELDAVSIGPNCRDFHSPSETLQISSVRKEFRYLRAILSAIE